MDLTSTKLARPHLVQCMLVLTNNSVGTTVVNNLSAGGSTVWTTAEKDESLAYGKKASDNAEQVNLKIT